jgi:hypothetical protein
MARLVLVGFPPTPAPGDWWCSYCVVLVKGTLLAPQMEQIEAGLADDTKEEFRIGVDPRKARELLQAAVTIGPIPQLGGAVGPVCWLHSMARDGNAPAEPPPEQQQGPGLIVPPGNDKTRRRLS